MSADTAAGTAAATTPGPLPPFKLERFFAQWEFNAKLLLCCSDSEPLSMAELLALADDETTQLWSSLTLHYTETQGLPALRQAIAQRLYASVAPEQLVVAAPQELVYLCMQARQPPRSSAAWKVPVLQRLHSPASARVGTCGREWLAGSDASGRGRPQVRLFDYRAFRHAGGQADSHTPVPPPPRPRLPCRRCCPPGTEWCAPSRATSPCMMWQPASDGAPRFDLAAAEKLITPGTRLVVVNSPHNPSGAHFSRAEWARLCALCEAAGAYLFSDEMYRWLELDPGADRLPAAADSLQRGISLCGMSKAAGGPGLRIGWLACKDAALVSRILELKDFTSICNSAPSEVLALIGVRSWDSIVDRQLSVLRANLDALDAFFARWPAVFEWRRPVAGTVAFPRLLTGEPVEAWCQELVQQAGVLLMPATVYDHPRSQQEGRFRLGYGRRNLPQCLAALEAWLQQRYPQAAAQPEHA